jgi:hypothetical protein
MSNLNYMIVFLIRLIHLSLVLFIVTSVFIKKIKYKISSLCILLYLLIRYISGNNKCGLTMLEYRYMGERYAEGFLFRLIKPVITTPEKYFDNYLLLFHLLWIIILIVQIYLYYTKKHNKDCNCDKCQNKLNDNNVDEQDIIVDEQDIIVDEQDIIVDEQDIIVECNN